MYYVVSGYFFTPFTKRSSKIINKKNPLKPRIKKATQDLDLDSKRGREHLQNKTPFVDRRGKCIDTT